MRYFVLLGALLVYTFSNACAQNLHESTWFFGRGHAIVFRNGLPQRGGIPAPVIPADYNTRGNENVLSQLAVSDEGGALQFFLQVKGMVGSGTLGVDEYVNNTCKVFDRQGNRFPNGNIKTQSRNPVTGTVGNPLAVPYPKQRNKYILFYSLHNSLRYSIVDMTLNRGMGDIDVAHKDVVLTGFGSIVGFKMTAIPACDGVWVVARAIDGEQYYSFKVDEQGVHPAYVVSHVGEGSLQKYTVVNKVVGGILKASNKGLLLAATTAAGIELYDFEPCSGRLKNARIIDTMVAYGLCFSPDDNRLYVSRSKVSWKGPFQGEIFQYDMTNSSLAAVAASKTLVMRNPIYELIVPYGPLYPVGPFGEMKLGPDGKIYVSKNNDVWISNAPCSVYYPGPEFDPVPVPGSFSCKLGQYMHVIHQPNAKGMACKPELDYVLISDMDLTPDYWLQNDIRVAPKSLPDTVVGATTPVVVCYTRQGVLYAPEDAACYLWDNGLATRDRVVEEPGTYWVSYFKGCTYRTDTFHVSFTPLPEVPQLQYACPAEGIVSVSQPKGDRTWFSYTLKQLEHDFIDSGASASGWRFEGLTAGPYSLQIRSADCDTTLLLQLEAYPAPEVEAWPGDTTILYGDTIQLHASGATRYAWWPLKHIPDAGVTDPYVWPKVNTTYFVIGRNDYDCVDTARVQVTIDYNLPDWVPNAFSPNGDGVNDLFRVAGLTYQQLLQFRVYNRFGQLLYSGTDPGGGWDGTYKGQPCELGTYYYFVELQYPDGKRRQSKGDVVLLR
jgi:gliding motility-associated-like protein